jgi:endonuclease-3
MRASDDDAAGIIDAAASAFGIVDGSTDEFDGMGPYQVLVSTIISQQISEACTRRICSELFSVYPSADDVYRADPAEIERIIWSSRYHGQKTRAIVSATRAIVEDCGGEVPDDLEGLLALPGVGRKTAACVLKFGFGKESVIVDSHISRVCRRTGISDGRNADAVQRDIEERVPMEMWGRLDRAFIALGREYCHPKDPDCGNCPVSGICSKII